MKEYKLLYQIKALEKQIGRLLIESVIRDRVISLTPTQMQIVEYILEHSNENIYQKDLEMVLNLRRATVSGVLQTMEKNQLIVRVVDTEDFRVKKIILNENAKKIFAAHKKKFDEIEGIITNDIPEKELQEFLNVIKKMQKNLEEYNNMKGRKK